MRLRISFAVAGILFSVFFIKAILPFNLLWQDEMEVFESSPDDKETENSTSFKKQDFLLDYYHSQFFAFFSDQINYRCQVVAECLPQPFFAIVVPPPKAIDGLLLLK